MTKPRAHRLLRAAPLLLLLVALVPMQLAGQSAAPQQATNWADDILKQESYAQPPKELAEAVLAPRHLNVTLSNLSPDKKWFVDEIGDGPVLMKTFSKPFHELGGVFIDYKANRSRTLTIRSSVGIQLISAADGAKRAVQTPPGTRVTNATWSPDSASVAYLAHTDDATTLWIADAVSGKSRQLTKTPLLATLVTNFEFTADGKQIAAVFLPDGRAAMPPAPTAPNGPTVKIADAEKNRLRTFPSLMSTTYDKELLEWHATGQVALIDVQKGAVRKIGQPMMVRAIDPSPDGKYVRVTRMTKPFSYNVPVSSFGQVEEVWDARRQGADQAERSRDQSRRAGRHAAARRSAGAPVAADAAANQTGQARDRLAHRRPGAHVPRAGTAASRRRPGRSRRRPWRRAPAAGDDAAAGEDAGRGARAAAAQGSPVPVAAAVRRREQEDAVREQHADDRPPVLA